MVYVMFEQIFVIMRELGWFAFEVTSRFWCCCNWAWGFSWILEIEDMSFVMQSILFQQHTTAQ
jgi:hypothetical protein